MLATKNCCDRDFHSALPPIKEYAPDLHEQESLHCLYNSLLQAGIYRILVLCKRTKDLVIQNFVLGAQGSRHTESSLVLARNSSNNSICLAEIVTVQQFQMIQMATQQNRLLQLNGSWIINAKYGLGIPPKCGLQQVTVVIACSSHSLSCCPH